MINPLINAMKHWYNGDIEVYKAEVQNYLDNPVAVGEHGNLIETMDGLVAKIAEADEKLFILEKYFGEDL
jgi:urease beta subunit